jgi:hypothetical protein
MQSLESILIFVTVADMGGFTRAADSLGIQGKSFNGGPKAGRGCRRQAPAPDDA